jgi:hypothetical protein
MESSDHRHIDDLPPEILQIVRDYQQIRNLLNDDTCLIGTNTPVAYRLLIFLQWLELRGPKLAKLMEEEWRRYRGDQKI